MREGVPDVASLHPGYAGVAEDIPGNAPFETPRQVDYHRRRDLRRTTT
jgi:hypothetical protein